MTKQKLKIVLNLNLNWIGQQGKFGHYQKLENGTLRLMPNADYVREGYKYTVDSLGRITSAGGKLRIDSYKGGLTTTLDYTQGYDRGHLIGRQFGGSPDLDNLVRMKESINRVNGEFYRLETSWKDALKLGQSVEVEIKINYPSFGGNVPSSFDVEYVVNGVRNVENIKNY